MAHAHSRRGFTLLELLIVVAIVGVLLTLSAAAVMKLIGSSETGATRTLLMRLESRLRHQMTTKADRLRAEPVPDPLPPATLNGALDTMNPKVMAGFYHDRSSLVPTGPFPQNPPRMVGGNLDLARVIYVKLRLKAEFPMTFRDALDPSMTHGPSSAAGGGDVRPLPSYVTYLRQRGVTAPAPGVAWPAPREHESAACLLMALKHGPDSVSEDEAGVGGSRKTIGGFECYVDAWGKPLIYCRAPTGVTGGVSIINPRGAPGGFNDPIDPKNTLLTPAFVTNPTLYANFRNRLHMLLPLGTGERPTLAPVIISMGHDGLAGVDLQTLGNPNEDSYDNVVTERFK